MGVTLPSGILVVDGADQDSTLLEETLGKSKQNFDLAPGLARELEIAHT